MSGNNMPTRKSPIQLRMQATMNAGGLQDCVKISPGSGAVTPAVEERIHKSIVKTTGYKQASEHLTAGEKCVDVPGPLEKKMMQVKIRTMLQYGIQDTKSYNSQTNTISGIVSYSMNSGLLVTKIISVYLMLTC